MHDDFSLFGWVLFLVVYARSLSRLRCSCFRVSASRLRVTRGTYAAEGLGRESENALRNCWTTAYFSNR